MKKFLVAVALVASVAACKSQTKSSVSDGSTAAPKADCCAGKDAKACDGAAKADCGKTCPVTGKPIN